MTTTVPYSRFGFPIVRSESTFPLPESMTAADEHLPAVRGEPDTPAHPTRTE
jgi:hypothetical protein